MLATTSSSFCHIGSHVGLGWGIEAVHVKGAGLTLSHGGMVPGYCAFLSAAPDSKLGAVVLANDEAGCGIVGEVGKKAMALALESKLGVAEQPEKPEPSKPKVRTIELSREALDAQVGDYIVMGQLTHVARSGDHLTADAFGKHFNLLPTAANEFVPEVSVLWGLWHKQLSDFSVTISTVQDRHFAVLHGLPQAIPAERFTHRPLSLAWARRLGECQVEPNEANFRFRQMRLEFVDGILAVDLRLSDSVFGFNDTPVHYLLDPIDDNHAVVVNADRSVVRVTGKPGHEKLLYSGFTFACNRIL